MLNVELLRPALVAGLEWLYETEQPPGAILTHHGVDLRVPEANRALSFVPAGYRQLPVVVVEVLDKARKYPDASPHSDQYWELADPLGDGELARVVQVIESLGRRIDTTWNGQPGSGSGSIGLLYRAGPSLRPVQAYRRGCPAHNGTVFCGHNARHGGEDCSWYRDGRAMVVMPTIPTTQEG